MTTDTRHRCPECSYVRTAELDAPAFHKPGCKTRRRLQGEQRKTTKPEPQNLMDYKGTPTKTVRLLEGDATCKLDDSGCIVAARSFDGLRWMAH